MCKTVALTPWIHLDLHGNSLPSKQHSFIHPAFITCMSVTFSCALEQVLLMVVSIAQTPTIPHGNIFFLWELLSTVVGLLSLFSRDTLSLLLACKMEGTKQPSTSLSLRATATSVALYEQQKSQGLKETLRGQPCPKTWLLHYGTGLPWARSIAYGSKHPSSKSSTINWDCILLFFKHFKVGVEWYPSQPWRKDQHIGV